MTSKKEVSEFKRNYLKALREENAAIFAGAGLSIPVGFLNWRELLKEIANDLGLDIAKEHDLIAITQYSVNEKNGRGHINQHILEAFTSTAKHSDNHTILAQLPIRTFWTTNYDNLIETALVQNKKLPDVKREPSNLSTTLPKRDAVVYKMHGDISAPEKATITKDDYQLYDTSHQLFSTALRGELVQKTFLFLGFSFEDPNLEYILSRIRLLLGENQRQHYCLIKEVNRKEFTTVAKYTYAKTLQDLKIRDLKRYSIQAIKIESYRQITEILSDLLREISLDTVFISGSAATYDPYSVDTANKFLEDISYSLAKEERKVVSGFGVGLGSSVINGVLKFVEDSNRQSIDEYLRLYPFPQNISDSAKRIAVWKQYREKMIQSCGVAVFLFGTKRNGASIINADGVLLEYKIAKEKRKFIIPVGITGGATKVIYDEVMADFKSYYPGLDELKDLFVALGDDKTTLESVPSIINSILKLITRR